MGKNDFGYFDFRYLGVTLCFDEAEDYNFFLDSETNNFSNLCDQERFQALLIKSSLVHEVRHFHDFLLTEYGNKLFFYWNALLFNGLQLFVDILRTSDKSHIYTIIPFCRWAALSTEERDSYIKRKKLNKKNIFNYLIFNEKKHKGTKIRFEQVITGYDRIENVFDGNKRFDFKKQYHFKNQDVFELSALLAQIQFIYQQYGIPDTQFFIDYILRMDFKEYKGTAKGCFLLFSVFASVLLENGELDTRLMSDAVTWSLFADDFSLESNDDPLNRFFTLLAAIDAGGIAWFNSSTKERFSQWSELLGMKTFKQHYDERHDMFMHYYGLIDRMKKMLSEVSGGIFSSIHSVAKKFNRVSLESLVDFEQDMEAYTHLDRYIQQTNLPMPTLNYKFNELVIDENTRKRLGSRLTYYKKGNGKYQIDTLDAKLSFSTPPFVEKEDASKYLIWSQSIDYLFYGTNKTTDIPAQEIIREQLKCSNVKLKYYFF